MPHKAEDDTLAKLELNQAELRKNIEASEKLIVRSDELLERYRSEHEGHFAERPEHVTK